mmetsp:Transcript_23369/g.28641  ORF Transcript_23369/g.28641 Transcript_23369/m.28641 type:complete len:427 (-) Transcript_23369:61-1341(-)
MLSISSKLSVGDWLKKFQNPVYNQYKSKFEDGGVLFVDDFLDLTNDDDIECFLIDIGITQRLHQNRLKREIKTIIKKLKNIKPKPDNIYDCVIPPKNAKSIKPKTDKAYDLIISKKNFNDGWVCEYCTYINYNFEAFKCEMCGMNRVQSTNIGYINKPKNDVKEDNDDDDESKYNDDFKQLDVLDGGFSRRIIIALSENINPSTANSILSGIAVSGGIITGATNVATTSASTVMGTQLATVSGMVGAASVGAGIASAATFAVKLGWDLYQYSKGNISGKELKRRTVKSFVLNASVCSCGIGGAAIGTMIVPGVGTVVGGIIGSIIGAGLAIFANKKIDKKSGQNYSQFNNTDFDLPDNPQQILKEAALMFGFKEKYLKDKKVFNITAVKRRYKALAKEFHPDHHGNHQLFLEFHTNYTILLTHLKE